MVVLSTKGGLEMTTFESILLLAVTVCVIITAFGVFVITRMLKEIIDSKYTNCEQLRKIETHTNFLPDISQQLENIENNILDDLRDIRLADKLGKTSPNVPTSLPCYAPNGICTNPQMDCINCPKRGTGGSWSTTLRAEGEMFQERFNGKEDKNE
jgi:hypothetical protein